MCVCISTQTKVKKEKRVKPFGFLFRRRGSDDDKTIDDDDNFFLVPPSAEMTRDFSRGKE